MTVTLNLLLRSPYSRPILLGLAAGGLSAMLWIAAAFAGGDARLALVYVAGALFPLALMLLLGTARLRRGQTSGSQERLANRAESEDRGLFFCSALEPGELARGRLELERNLRDALDRKELVLFYQPLVDLKTRKLVALEALLRWRHPEHGVLRPGSFLSLAEDSGLILPISEWALEAACQQIGSMQDSGESPVSIAVNVSRSQFFQPGFEESVMRTVGRSGIDPTALALELTESLVMRNLEHARQRIDRLRQFGVRISIDDFGAGGASLALLQRLRIDSLKIDRSFIQGLKTSPRNLRFVDSIVRLTRSLGVSAVAEGVESIPQLRALRSVECGLAQGYLFGMPLPAGDIGRWMAHQHTTSSARLRPASFE